MNLYSIKSQCFQRSVLYLRNRMSQMRSCYLWPVFSPLLLPALVNTKTLSTSAGATAGNWFALNAQEVFRNEPGSTASNAGGPC